MVEQLKEDAARGRVRGVGGWVRWIVGNGKKIALCVCMRSISILTVVNSKGVRIDQFNSRSHAGIGAELELSEK